MLKNHLIQYFIKIPKNKEKLRYKVMQKYNIYKII